MVINTSNDITSKATAHSNHKLSSTAGSADKKSADNISSSSHTPREQVQLSQEAQTFKRLESKIFDSKGVDSGKVEALKQQIAEGQYNIDNDRIAEKLLQQDGL